MIRHGLLVFPAGPDRVGSTDRRVAGLPLLDRGIRAMARTGIDHLTVIVPEGAPQPLSGLVRRLPLALQVLTWKQARTVAWAADAAVLVVLGDHVHHATSLQELAKAGLGQADLVIQTSAAPRGTEALWSASTAGTGVRLTTAAAGAGPVSTGAFVCRGSLLTAAGLPAAETAWYPWLEQAAAGHPVALQPARAERWHPVRDRRGARAAKKMLFSLVTKPTSGFVSRHINARISIPISKALINTGISPHVVTVCLVLTTGLASAWLLAHGDSYGRLAVAGILWQMAAVLDRCDGEIARVKLCESKFGAWFDTVTDNLAYLCGYVALLVGIRRLHPAEPLYTYLWFSAAGALLLTLVTLYTYARRSGSGSLQHYLRDLARDLPDRDKGWVQRWMQRYGFVAKRDFLSFVLCLAMLANSLEAVFWILVVLLHLAAAGVLISQRKMLARAHAENARRAAEGAGGVRL